MEFITSPAVRPAGTRAPSPANLACPDHSAVLLLEWSSLVCERELRTGRIPRGWVELQSTIEQPIDVPSQARLTASDPHEMRVMWLDNMSLALVLLAPLPEVGLR